jgi:hypothetical protein
VRLIPPAYVKPYVKRQKNDAAVDLDRAVELNPNSARAWNERGWTYRHSEQTEEEIQSFVEKRMSPG